MTAQDLTMRSIITGALVLRIPLADFDELKKLIFEKYPQTTIVYSRTSAGKLFIRDDEARKQ